MPMILTELPDDSSRPSDWDLEHMDDIIAGHGDWFTAQLLRLCAKADSLNLERIRMGFPAVVEAFERWRNQ